MIGFLTSCGRFDLLKETLTSFFEDQQEKVFLKIHEDGNFRAGQHTSIENFLLTNKGNKYYVHLEDDWQFKNTYDWIEDSIRIMEADQSIIKVLCNSDSPHPCVFDYGNYGILTPWENNGIKWHGFSWNPGVTRLDLLSKMIHFPRYEQELAEKIYHQNYKVARLSTGVCWHIGQNRSTHD